MAELRKGARVRIKAPSLFDPSHSRAPVGFVVRMPYEDLEDGAPRHVTDRRAMVQVGQEKRPRPVRPEHLEVL